jgi:hypothetical protein
LKEGPAVSDRPQAMPVPQPRRLRTKLQRHPEQPIQEGMSSPLLRFAVAIPKMDELVARMGISTNKKRLKSMLPTRTEAIPVKRNNMVNPPNTDGNIMHLV